ncbi:phage tail protein [Microbulbifer sp. VAAF005]|uniref:phage tail protein n=1 Tax=Microbulbifer sp. VAAF005 TaxID=3034230 RepID=UPI0024AD20B5|nr:phage tail protein [Microbulbifer sp. VAAF005]WHI46798.1 phage tail protein [Microbulbifer sp. VAAF005]
MAGKKLQEITAHLLAANLVPQEKFESWMEEGRIETASKNLGNGIRISRTEYDAVIVLEEYSGDAALVLALVTTWLMENDSSRFDNGMPEPQIEVTPIDDKSVDVEITIRFFENVDLVPDDNGPISYQGQRYAIATVPIDEPSQVAVGDNKELPTDAPYNRAD